MRLKHKLGIMQISLIDGRNQKPLNYEIETPLCLFQVIPTFSRNQKPLNYEIETMNMWRVEQARRDVEIKSLSIMRLKLTNSHHHQTEHLQ